MLWNLHSAGYESHEDADHTGDRDENRDDGDFHDDTVLEGCFSSELVSLKSRPKAVAVSVS